MRCKIKDKLDNPYLNIAIIIISVLLFSLALTYGVEFMQRGDLGSVLNWAKENTIQFSFNYIIILTVVTVIVSLVGCVYIGFSISGILMFLLAVVNHYKFKLRGDPLFPWDLLLNEEAGDMVSLVSSTKELVLIGMIILGFILFGLLKFVLPKLSIKLIYRIPIFALSLMVLYTLGLNPAFLGHNVYTKAQVQNITWKQDENYLQNGFSLAFTMNFKNAIITEPDNYNKDNILGVFNDIEDMSTGSNSDIKPNLIIIMNEAFWDPTLLKNISFNEDPMENLRDEMENHTSGWMVSPEFGGGTSNIEFEVLTGNSVSFLPAGSMAYQQYINRPTMSLASILKKQDYKSIAIHSYEAWFWNRNTVYKDLGFDKFISSEYFVDPEMKGYFISDNEVSNMIIEETEKYEEPVFIYAITMQNHGPYNDDRYGDTEIQVSDSLPMESEQIVETYSQGVKDGDEALKNLLDNLEESDEPTVVVFFGDHLPMLGENNMVYRETGYLDPNPDASIGQKDQIKMNSVPLLIWSNYEHNKKDLGVISASFLGPYILDYIGLDMPPYFEFINNLREKTPVVTRALRIDNGDNIYSIEENKFKESIDNYWSLQFDHMFGKDYLNNEDKTWVDLSNEDYNAELNKPVVKEVTSRILENGSLELAISGDNFNDSSKIYLGSNQLETVLINKRTIKTNVSSNLYNNKEHLDIQVKVVNMKNRVIDESSVYEYEIK